MDIEQQAATRLAEVQALIARAAKTADRDPADVKLIAISKTHPADAILPLIHAGQRVFGENRVQEAQAKWPELKAVYADVELHLVGQLQSNKAVDAVGLFDAIHSRSEGRRGGKECGSKCRIRWLPYH